MRKSLYILGQLDDDDVEWLIDHGRRVSVEPGQTIIRQGEPADSIYFVLSGAFSVRDEHLGRDIARVGAGEIMGELSFVDSGAPSATVRAAAPSDVLAVPRGALAQKLAADTGCAARFYRAIAMFLADRLRNIVTNLGYGSGPPALQDGVEPDELDLNVLDNLHLAGARFDRLLHGARAEPLHAPAPPGSA